MHCKFLMYKLLACVSETSGISLDAMYDAIVVTTDNAESTQATHAMWSIQNSSPHQSGA